MNYTRRNIIVLLMTMAIAASLLMGTLMPSVGDSFLQANATPTVELMQAGPSTTPTPGVADLSSHLSGKRIFFASSNGEANFFDRSAEGATRFANLLRAMGAELDTIDWERSLPQTIDLVVITGPTQAYSLPQTARLWAYLEGGGAILLLTDPPAGGNNAAFAQNSGFFTVTWTDIGLRGLDHVLVQHTDNTAPRPNAPNTAARTDGDRAATSPRVISIVSSFASTILVPHPITSGLRAIQFAEVRSFEVDIDPSEQSYILQPLILSTSDFFGETNLGAFSENVSEFNIGTDDTYGTFVLAVAYRHLENQGRMVVVGDRDVATNGVGLRESPPNSGRYLYADNVQFLVNAVTWLLVLPDIDLKFEAPGPTATPTITPSPTITPTPEPTATAAEGS